MRYSFAHDKSTPLCEIMGRNKSDKGSQNITASWHNYTTFYYSIFKHLQNKPIRLFELGLGTNNVNIPSNMGSNGVPGASLFGWREFFPNAQIFGADIDQNILFNTENIMTFFCDQCNPSMIRNLWNHEELNSNFDIIIDDGLHEFDANICFFENSLHKLNVNGIFIIEDIHVNYLNKVGDKIAEWENAYPNYVFTLVEIPSVKNKLDNNLLVIHRLYE
jgi:hypothetical protein